ncbi:Rad17-domain-containing protein [Gymnopus androsaceus JB14]|uniref:Rad17-domain-containing protein n=1 Tax=Gymnopus androsaceus JB14 TaxID=1447944 RepID=A0A6A4GNZ0_9AGAR|nr:Rad17-domain-containing protein [Gymnopus androsaceus JB14]
MNRSQIHVRKVENVQTWLQEALNGGPSGKLRKYRRLLVLTGPAGTAKSATIKVLSKELNFEVLEWSNSTGSTFTNAQDASSSWIADDSNFTKFQLFLERASKYQNVFNCSTSRKPSFSTSTSKSSSSNYRVILEDLPNIYMPTLARSFTMPRTGPNCYCFEAGDKRLASGAWGRDQDGAVDIRTLLLKDVLHGPYVHEIRFNPIAPTLMKKALQALVTKHYALQKSPVTGQMFDIIIESSNGVIRSAIMALQFACIRLIKKPKRGDPQVLMESITRREQNLVLFHLMGKVLFNKRKGNLPNPSATAKDIKKDQEIDRKLTDPPLLPPHLSEHDRRASRTIYADSPIDSSLFSLYIHQKFTQFYTDVDECDGIADWLSWADSSGANFGAQWYPINPHRFHLLALGTLHSLPTPVPRLNQKVYKPEFFDNLKKEKEAWEGVRDVRSWIVDQGAESGWDLGAWTPRAIATDLGGVLRARDAASSSSGSAGQRVPPRHRTFSSLKFIYPKSDMKSAGKEQLGETDDGEPYSEGAIVLEEQQEMGMWQDGNGSEPVMSKAEAGGWLEGDDIEDL